MFRRTIYLILSIALIGMEGMAQALEPRVARESEVYCSGLVTTQPPNSDTYVISGPESAVAIQFTQGDEVFINRGASQGVRVGDQFLVTRVESEQIHSPWFTWQPSLMRAMGKYYADLGRIRVVSVQQNTSIAEVEFSCSPILRGDIVQPFAERPAPAYKTDTKFDRLAPPSGKAKAMVVFSQGFGQVAGAGKIVYVNLGSAQGVRTGDFFRMFRYQDQRHETVYKTAGTAYRIYGMGSTPRSYSYEELPRDVLGEGLVLRTGPNAATVLITNSQQAIYVGDYVELE